MPAAIQVTLAVPGVDQADSSRLQVLVYGASPISEAVLSRAVDVFGSRYVYVLDRLKDMIVSGGENVHPAEVENVLMAHPGVADSGGIGVPDERWGETGKALVVRAEGAEVTERDLIDFCRELGVHSGPDTRPHRGTFPRFQRGWSGMEDTTRIDLYRTMVLIRAFETALLGDYHADKKPQWDIGAGLIPGEMHLAAGQEPVAAGICAHLNTDDAITGPHRPHHLAIAHGIDLDRMAAEIYGRATGLCRGKGGHMHLFDPATHFSCSGIIAEGYPVSCGQALAFKREGKGRVSVAVAGEGAANQGAFHESLNLAALWRLPVVFVIEDNDWAISVPRSMSTAVASNAERAGGYGIPGVRIEGNDVEAIHEAAGEAIARARAGQGPSLLEVHTVRLWGHFEGDAQAYRGTELDRLAERDPIPQYAARLQDLGVLDDDGIAEIASACQARVDAAIDFAKSSPEPAPETALEDVFA